MSLLLLALALLVTVLPCWAWLARLVPPGVPARPALLAGYSLLLGMLLTGLLLRLLSLVGVPFSLAVITGVALLLVLAARLLPAPPSAAAATAAPLSRPEQLFIALCLALLASRLLVLGLELGTRPVTAWDTKQHWAKQAKVFFEYRGVVPFVPASEWLAQGGHGVFTNLHPDYPITTPLLQAWIAIALGQWHDSWVNAPWLLMWLALGLVCYGQARLAGAGAALATGAAFMLLSLPYLNIQVALAGYADLLLAGCFLAAVAAFDNWCRHRDRWQLALALAAGAGGLLVKNEGFYWFLALWPGLLLVWLGARRGLMLLAVLAIAVVLALWLLPADLVIAGHTLADADLGYRPASWGPLLFSALVHDNWHFTLYLALPALLVVPLLARQRLPLAAVVVSALVLYLALYLFTSNAVGAERYTSLNRVALQLVPALGYFALAVLLDVMAAVPARETNHG